MEEYLYDNIHHVCTEQQQPSVDLYLGIFI